MSYSEYQQPHGAQGQQTAGTSQYGGSSMGQHGGTEMGSQTWSETGYQGGSQTGQGTGQTQQGSSQMHQGMGMGMRLSDVETSQQRMAVEDVTRAIQVCGWCADQCVQEADPSMIECIRLCEDVTELGETVLALLPRNSRYADSLLGTFQQAVQACAQECGQHHHGHCQECAEVLGYTSESIQELFGAYGRQGGTTGQQGGSMSQHGGSMAGQGETTSQHGGTTGQQMTSW